MAQANPVTAVATLLAEMTGKQEQATRALAHDRIFSRERALRLMSVRDFAHLQDMYVIRETTVDGEAGFVIRDNLRKWYRNH